MVHPSLMEFPALRPKARRLQREHLPSSIPRRTNTTPSTVPNTPPVSEIMMSTSRTITTGPTPYRGSYAHVVNVLYSRSHSHSQSPEQVFQTTTLETYTSYSQPPTSAESPDLDEEKGFSPILPIKRSSSDNKIWGKTEDQSIANLPTNESDWQDAQARESQYLCNAIDEGEWVDPLEGILEPLVVEEWLLIEEDDDDAAWRDEEDWHDTDIQKEWVDMIKEHAVDGKRRKVTKQKAV